MTTLLAELNWANLIALLTVISGIAGTWWMNASSRKKQAADTALAAQTAQATSHKELTDQWEEWAKELRATVKSQGEEIRAMRAHAAEADRAHREEMAALKRGYEERMAGLECRLREACEERDVAQGKQQALERKVADLEREIDALRKQANRVRP